ncbi:MAG: sterol desaturase family protein, partial [Bdellovibrionota bacterium]
MTWQAFGDLLFGQVVHLGAFVCLGLLLARRELKAPARQIQLYNEHRIDIAAVVMAFCGAIAFGVLIAQLRTFEGLRPLQSAIGSLPWYVLIIGTSLIGDLLNYLSHRLLHTAYFWRFHRWHHSPEHLFWFSGFRGSFVHLFIMALKNIVILSITDLNPWVLGTLAVQGMLAQLLSHVNFDVHIPILSRIVVMPQYHRIHHAVDRAKHDSNYGFVWTFWDKIFGTQTDPSETSKDFELGLPKNEKVSIRQMLV